MMKGKMQRQSDCQKLPLSEGSTMDMEREKNGMMPALHTGGFFHIIQLNSGKAELSVFLHFPSQKKRPQELTGFERKCLLVSIHTNSF